MKLAIVGAGRIGTAVAFQLAKAGHDVSLVARGKRLEALQRDGSIETVKGERVSVQGLATLGDVAWDLVIVTVLAHQVDALLPSLGASKAGSVMFMFNTFDALDRLRDAVGEARFVMSFPVMTATFVDGKLKHRVKGPGLSTTMSSAQWAETFVKAGLPAVVEPDMESFLRSHAAFVVPLMVAGCQAYARQGGVTWAQARANAAALKEGLALVKSLGNKVIPGFVATLGRMPSAMLASIIWSMSRTASVRDLGEFGGAEARELIDAMVKAGPDKTPRLQAIRP